MVRHGSISSLNFSFFEIASRAHSIYRLAYSENSHSNLCVPQVFTFFKHFIEALISELIQLINYRTAVHAVVKIIMKNRKKIFDFDELSVVSFQLVRWMIQTFLFDDQMQSNRNNTVPNNMMQSLPMILSFILILWVIHNLFITKLRRCKRMHIDIIEYDFQRLTRQKQKKSQKKNCTHS